MDISEGGLSALLKIETPIDEVVRLEFLLPYGAVSVHALVRHRDAFRYGFQFLELDHETHACVKRTTYWLGGTPTFRDPATEEASGSSN